MLLRRYIIELQTSMKYAIGISNATFSEQFLDHSQEGNPQIVTASHLIALASCCCGVSGVIPISEKSRGLCPFRSLGIIRHRFHVVKSSQTKLDSCRELTYQKDAKGHLWAGVKEEPSVASATHSALKGMPPLPSCTLGQIT